MVTGGNWTKGRFGEGWGRQCFGRLENMRSPAALECRDKSSHSSGRHTCLESTLFRDITITAPSCSMRFCGIRRPCAWRFVVLSIDQAGCETRATATVSQALLLSAQVENSRQQTCLRDGPSCSLSPSDTQSSTIL
jgi:hypothetical protein